MNTELQLNVYDRLQSFHNMEDGWCLPESFAPSSESIEFARRICNHSIKLGATNIGVFPHPKGDIIFEGIKFPNGRSLDVYMDEGLTFAIYNDEINDFEVYDENLTEEEVLNRITLYSQEPI